jgi:multiple sugar transport system substrate-binding protein
MRKICLWAFLLIITAGCIFAGAVQETSVAVDPSMPYKGTTLKVMGSTNSHTLVLQEKMQEIANEMGINLEIITYSWPDAVKKLRLDYASGETSWDIVYTDNRYLTLWKNIGAVTPVQDFIDNPKIADPRIKEEIKDVMPTFTDLVMRDGKMYQFPFALDTLVMAYRTDLLNDPTEKANFKKRYGYELKVPETYQEFYNIAQFFTRKKGDLLMGKVLQEDFYGTVHSQLRGDYIQHDFIPYVMAFGGNLYHNPSTMMPEWNDKIHKDAFRFMLSLKPFMPAEVGVMTSGESLAQFTSGGRVAIVLEWADRTIKSASDPATSKVIGKWDYTAPPSVPGTGVNNASFKNIISYMIYSKSKNQEAAYKLMERMAMREEAMDMIINKALIPPRPSIINDPEVRKLPWAGSLGKILNENIDYFWHPDFELNLEIVDLTGESLGIAWTNEKVDEEFDKVQNELVQLYQREGYIK